MKDHLVAITKHTKIRVAAIVGGLATQKQERLLAMAPEIVVGTPGEDSIICFLFFFSVEDFVSSCS